MIPNCCPITVETNSVINSSSTIIIQPDHELTTTNSNTPNFASNVLTLSDIVASPHFLMLVSAVL